jgi:hypothetical protein
MMISLPAKQSGGTTMALYLCRWGNGDFSVVQADDKEHVIEMLDEIANAEGVPLHAITGFMAHFRLTDEGIVEFDGFGEQFGDYVRERVHPVLGGLDVSPYDASAEEKPRIVAAVQAERTRLKSKPAPEPDTELGKRIKAQTDLPTSVINKHVHNTAKEVLQKIKPKDKPN